MLRATVVVLAASTLMTLVAWASPPAPEETSVNQLRLAVPAGAGDVPFEGTYRALSLEQRQALSDGWITFRTSPPARKVRQICLAAGENATDGEATDICQFGAAVSQAPPCLASGDCPAYESWERVMGSPGIQQAPETKVRAAVVARELVEVPK